VGSKGGRYVGLTTLPPSCADCLEIRESHSLGTVWTCPGLCRDCFTFLTTASKENIRELAQWTLISCMLVFSLTSSHNHHVYITATNYKIFSAELIKVSALPHRVLDSRSIALLRLSNYYSIIIIIIIIIAVNI